MQYSDWREAVLPEDLPENERILQETVQRAGSSRRTFRIRRRSDGESRHIEAVETVRTNAKDEVEWVVGTNLDVTDRVRTEAEIRRNEELVRTNTDITEQRQLEKSRSTLAAIVESSEDAIISKDLDGVITSWNRGAERLYGYTAEEAIGQPITMLIPTDLKNEESVILERIRQGETIAHYETVRCRKDRTPVEVSLTISPIKDTGGKIIGASKIVRDITERKEAEDALRVSQQFTRSVLENLYAFVGVMSTDGTLTYANRAPVEAGGILAGDVIGKKFWDCYWWSYSPEIQAQLRDACERAATGEAVRYDVPVRMAGDSRVWIDFQVAPLRDTEGRITHLIPTAMDIALRHAAEQKLRESEARFRQVTNTMPQIVWTARPDGYIDYYNERWYEFTGFPRDEFGSSSWEPLLHPDDVQRCIETYFGCIRSGQPYQIEYRFKDRATGAWRWFIGRALPVRDERGEITRWFGTCTDIDDQRQMVNDLKEVQGQLTELAADLELRVQQRTADLLFANEQLQGFTYSVAHDLRQQIRGISTNSTILLQDAGNVIPQANQDNLKSLVRSSKQLARLVDDLLGYARLAKHEPRLEPIDLSAMAREVSLYLAERDHCSPQTRFEIAPGLVSKGDATMMRIALDNLMDNACKYSSRTPTPFVEVGEDAQGFFVRDNGIGIDMTYAHKLFQPFERLLRDPDYSGTGIGLANVKRIIEKHGGRVWVESVMNQGSTFYFTLPVPEPS